MIEASGGVVHWLRTADGLSVRAAHWPGAGRGTVLLLQGMGEFIEKYLEPVERLRAMGFAVWTLDWRGQGFSDPVGPVTDCRHIERFDAFQLDLDPLLERWRATAGGDPLLMMAHSMGGAIGLHLLARRPSLVERSVLCAPMIEFLPGPAPVKAVLRRLIGIACRLPGQWVRPAPGAAKVRRWDDAFQGNRLTGSPERYAADRALMQDEPRLQGSGVTWGWMRAAAEGVMALRQPGFAEGLDVPILVAIPGDEGVVDAAAIHAFAARLPRAERLLLPGARHELLRERDPIQAILWSAIDRFFSEGSVQRPPIRRTGGSDRPPI